MEELFHHFSTPSSFQRENLCYSDGMGVEINPNFRIDRGSFDNYLIMYVETGKLWHEQYGEKIAVMPGEYIFVNLKVRHCYYFEPDTPSRIRWIHLNGWVVEGMAERIGAVSALPFRAHSEEMGEDLLGCFGCSGESMEEKEALSGKIYEILLKILKAARRRHIRPEDDGIQRFREQATYAISEAVYQPASLAELAQRMHLSKYYFCRTFEEIFGQPPMRYLMQEKLQIARYHLLYTAEPVSEIAQLLGFSSQAYFSRSFKKEWGVSPTEFRRDGRHPAPQKEKTSPQESEERVGEGGNSATPA